MTYLPCIYFLRAPVLDRGLKIKETVLPRTYFLCALVLPRSWTGASSPSYVCRPWCVCKIDKAIKLTKKWTLKANLGFKIVLYISFKRAVQSSGFENKHFLLNACFLSRIFKQAWCKQRLRQWNEI